MGLISKTIGSFENYYIYYYAFLQNYICTYVVVLNNTLLQTSYNVVKWCYAINRLKRLVYVHIHTLVNPFFSFEVK